MIKLKLENIDVWVNPYILRQEMVYMEREQRPDTKLMLANERKYYTNIVLKSGKSFMVDNTPDEIIELLTKKVS